MRMLPRFRREYRYLKGTHPEEWFRHTDEALDRLTKHPDYEVRYVKNLALILLGAALAVFVVVLGWLFIVMLTAPRM